MDFKLGYRRNSVFANVLNSVMSLSNRVINKFGLNEKCQSFQSAFLLFLQNHRHITTVNEIGFETLKEQLEHDGIVLVDVRDPEEVKEFGRIPRSVNIPSSQIEEAFSLPPALFESRYGVKMPDPESCNLALSCKSGRRAALAYEKLVKFGYLKAKVYCGSFQDWVAKGGQLEK